MYNCFMCFFVSKHGSVLVLWLYFRVSLVVVDVVAVVFVLFHGLRLFAACARGQPQSAGAPRCTGPASVGVRAVPAFARPAFARLAGQSRTTARPLPPAAAAAAAAAATGLQGKL